MNSKTTLLEKRLELKYPIMGLYDTPNTIPYGDFKKVNTCMFSYFRTITNGNYIQLSKEKFGCPGAGKWLFNIETKTKKQFIDFLIEREGLKSSPEVVSLWFDSVQPYNPKNNYLFYGPLQPKEYEYLKTITFYVNPDQLSILTIGAQFDTKPNDPEPVIAPFGSGCLQLISLFKDLNIPQGIIGATDIAMRKSIPKDIIAFTVTKPMFEKLLSISDDSYLNKSFIKRLNSIRNIQNMKGI